MNNNNVEDNVPVSIDTNKIDNDILLKDHKNNKKDKIIHIIHTTNNETHLCEIKRFEIHKDQYTDCKNEAFKRTLSRNLLCVIVTSFIDIWTFIGAVYAIVKVSELWWIWTLMFLAVTTISIILTYLLIKMNYDLEIDNVIINSRLI